MQGCGVTAINYKTKGDIVVKGDHNGHDDIAEIDRIKLRSSAITALKIYPRETPLSAYNAAHETSKETLMGKGFQNRRLFYHYQNSKI